MKKFLTVFSVLIFSAALSFSQKKVSFVETEFNFGTIKQGTPVTHKFVFKNNEESGVVVVTNVQTSCGCTKPEWPQAPIMPGKEGIILIGYDAAKIGKFNKTIFVTIEGNNNPLELVIKGEVTN